MKKVLSWLLVITIMMTVVALPMAVSAEETATEDTTEDTTTDDTSEEQPQTSKQVVHFNYDFEDYQTTGTLDFPKSKTAGVTGGSWQTIMPNAGNIVQGVDGNAFHFTKVDTIGMYANYDPTANVTSGKWLYSFDMAYNLSSTNARVAWVMNNSSPQYLYFVALQHPTSTTVSSVTAAWTNASGAMRNQGNLFKATDSEKEYTVDVLLDFDNNLITYYVNGAYVTSNKISGATDYEFAGTSFKFNLNNNINKLDNFMLIENPDAQYSFTQKGEVTTVSEYITVRFSDTVYLTDITDFIITDANGGTVATVTEIQQTNGRLYNLKLSNTLKPGTYNLTLADKTLTSVIAGTTSSNTRSEFTVEQDDTYFEADFEDVSSASEAGLTFVYGASQCEVVDAEDASYGKVLQFSATETVASRFKVPVNALNPANKSVSMSFDLYAEEADKIYCMIYLYDSNGKDYKILCRNSNQAAGQMGYFKFLNIGAPWKPVGTVAKGAGTWVHVDGIFEFRDNQAIIKWYFDGVKAGTTYSYALKDISYIRFNVNKTETADVTKTYAIDNILMRQYENNSFNAEYAISGTTLEIKPKSNLSKDFSAENCNFEIVNSQTGKAVTVASKEYKDGKIVLTLSGLEYSQPYTVTSSDFCDIYGQKMNSFEFTSNPQYDASNAVVPQIKAVWFYDHDGNRLTANQVTTEVNKMEILFNTRIKASTITGISFGDLTLTGEYSSKNNSYTATWGGYLAPNTSYPLSVTGITDVNGKTIEDYNKTVTTGNGTVSVKDIELLNSAGDRATATDIVEGAVLTAKLSVLNTTGEAVNGVLAYGIYKDSYMTDRDFTAHYIENGVVTEVDMEIPYADADANLKVFMWDEFSKLNAYSKSFDFQAEE